MADFASTDQLVVSRRETALVQVTEQPIDERLVQAVTKLLSACEAAGLAAKHVDLDNPETGFLFVAIISANGYDAETVELATLTVVSRLKFFPKPSEILEVLAEVRARRRQEREREYWSRVVECEDDQGRKCLAPPESVRAGKLLPEGDLSGDGSRAPVRPVLAERVAAGREHLRRLNSGG